MQTKTGVIMTDPASCGAAAGGISVNAATAMNVCGAVLVLSSLLIVAVLAAVLMMALTPPRTKLETAGMISAAFGNSYLVGPWVIENYGLTSLSFQAQLGVCFCMAAPAWLLWRIVSNQLARWRDSKNPLGTISRDVRQARRDR